MAEEELLEVGVVAGYGKGELRELEIARETLWQRRRDTDSLLDDIGKFGGMGSGKDQAL